MQRCSCWVDGNQIPTCYILRQAQRRYSILRGDFNAGSLFPQCRRSGSVLLSRSPFRRPPFLCSWVWGRASWRCGVEAPAPPSSTGMPAGRGSLAVCLLQRRDTGNPHRVDRVHIGRAGRCTLALRLYTAAIRYSRTIVLLAPGNFVRKVRNVWTLQSRCVTSISPSTNPPKAFCTAHCYLDSFEPSSRFIHRKLSTESCPFPSHQSRVTLTRIIFQQSSIPESSTKSQLGDVFNLGPRQDGREQRRGHRPRGRGWWRGVRVFRARHRLRRGCAVCIYWGPCGD